MLITMFCMVKDKCCQWINIISLLSDLCSMKATLVKLIYLVTDKCGFKLLQ